MSFLGRWLSRILPVRPLQKAAKPEPNEANDELDLSRLPFRPYQVEQNDRGEWVIRRENRLQDVIRDAYLKNAVMWLLGYDARYPLVEQSNDAPIRAQQAHTPWHMAWNIHTLVQARPILIREHPELVAEVDRKLPNAISWLLNQKRQHDSASIHWEQRQYDTGIIVSALLSVLGDYPSLDPELAREIKSAVISALAWLAAGVHDRRLAKDYTSRSGMEVLALASAWRYLQPAERRHAFDRYGGSDAVLTRVVEENLLRLQTQDSGEILEGQACVEGEESPFAVDSRALALSCVLKVATTALQPALSARVKETLLRGIQHVERRAESDNWGDPAKRARLLMGYIEALPTTLRTPGLAEGKIVLQCLYYFSGHNYFEDGSIFHDLYATTYFAECLISAYNSWMGVKPLVTIYKDLLRGHDLEVTEEREQIFELERRLIAAERQYSQLDAEAIATRRHNKQLRRLLLLFSVGLMLSVVAIVWIMPWLGIGGLGPYVNTDQTEAFLALAGLVAGLTAAMVTAIEIIFFRDEKDDRGQDR